MGRVEEIQALIGISRRTIPCRHCQRGSVGRLIPAQANVVYDAKPASII